MDLYDLWTSPWNTPAPPERERLVRQAFDALRHAQRRRTRFLVVTAGLLLASTALVGGGLLAPGTDAPALPTLLLAAQWGVFALVLRQWRRARTASAAPAATIRESLQGLWAECESSRRRQLAVVGLFALAAPVLAVALVQLRQAGKMAPHEAASAAVLFAVIIAFNLGAILVRRYRVVLPQRRRLEELLREYRA
jgi:hypothetical protein